MKLHHLFALLAAGTAPAFGGVIYTPNFSGSVGGAPIQTIAQSNAGTPGLDGWKQSIANDADDSPRAWVTTFTDRGPGGTIGGIWEDNNYPDSHTSFGISRAINNEPLSGSTLVLDFGIARSSAGYPDKDNFSITIANSNGDGLFTLDFAPTSGTYWNVSWSSSSGGSSSGAVFAVDSDPTSYDASDNVIVSYPIYRYTVSFVQSGGDVSASYSVDNLHGSSYADTVTLSGLAGQTITELQIGTTRTGADWGDNSFVFVPEPSAAMLLLLSGFGFLRRRR